MTLLEKLAPRLPALDDDDLRHLFCVKCFPGPYPGVATAVCGTDSLCRGHEPWTFGAAPEDCLVCLDLVESHRATHTRWF